MKKPQEIKNNYAGCADAGETQKNDTGGIAGFITLSTEITNVKGNIRRRKSKDAKSYTKNA